MCYVYRVTGHNARGKMQETQKMLIHYHVSQDGIAIYDAGKLVALIHPDKFPDLICQMARILRDRAA